MYDELIKNLRICSRCDFGQDCNGCTQRTDDAFCCDKLLHQAADAIEELQAQLMYSNDAAKAIAEKVPKWIPVTERLPKIGDPVLCYCRANIYEIMSMQANGGWMGDGVMYMSSFVTHWMPRPKAPEEE